MNTARSASVMATFTDCSTSTIVVPAGVDRLHDLEQLLDDHRRQPERQLVDHQQLRAGDEGLAEREHLLLAARQVAGLLVPPLAQDREVLEHLLGGLLHVLRVLAEQPAGQVEVLLDGERREHALAAGHQHDAGAPPSRWRRAGDVDAVEGDRARPTGDDRPEIAAQQRRLAGAVRAEQRDDLASSTWKSTPNSTCVLP